MEEKQVSQQVINDIANIIDANCNQEHKCIECDCYEYTHILHGIRCSSIYCAKKILEYLKECQIDSIK